MRVPELRQRPSGGVPGRLGALARRTLLPNRSKIGYVSLKVARGPQEQLRSGSGALAPEEGRSTAGDPVGAPLRAEVKGS